MMILTRTKKKTYVKSIAGSAADLIDVADHVEGDLREMVVLALQDLLEAGDGLLNGHQLAGVVREHLRNLERLKYVTDFLDANSSFLFSFPRNGEFCFPQDGFQIETKISRFCWNFVTPHVVFL